MQARREDGVEKAGYSDQRRNRDKTLEIGKKHRIRALRIRIFYFLFSSKHCMYRSICDRFTI